MISKKKTVLPLLKTELSWLNAVSHFFWFIPRSVLDGLLTALHIKLNHPSRFNDSSLLWSWMTPFPMWHPCATPVPPFVIAASLISQSSDDSPEVVGVSFIRWHHQASSSIDSSSLRMHHILHRFFFDTRLETWRSLQRPHTSNNLSTPSWWS